jgi:phosphoribosyl-ATP pyrophosphohydrolase/phosphoribosyl-AMP cyclohydrolase/histidinol dehydrogenase
MLVATDANVIEQVERELDRALPALSTAGTARAALANGFALLAEGIDEAIALADRIAPEHLQIMTRRAEEIARRCRHYGAVFIGQRSAEVLGDYGIGPNHTLPTGGTARSFGGLNVLNFLRIRTWLRIDGHATAALQDAAQLADLEGLPAHAAAARIRS